MSAVRATTEPVTGWLVRLHPGDDLYYDGSCVLVPSPTDPPECVIKGYSGVMTRDHYRSVLELARGMCFCKLRYERHERGRMVPRVVNL